ncbi:MAG: M28 family peptidase, partial [Pyrinomonadaceae bacterium]|nr:M28 family peptidase [Pyrinomonadaceae bacterium]
MTKLPSIIAALFIFAIIPVCVSAQRPAMQFSTEAELKSDLETAPCSKNKDRREAVVALFKKAGAADTDIKIEGKDGLENVVVTKKGTTADTVVIGAHYDKTADGCGVLDNWTGIVVLANIYRTMRPHDTQKTFVFVAFDEEEKGLLGSNAFAGEIPKSERKNYCAMINFDSFGMAAPQALGNVSSSSLIKVAESASAQLKIPFASAGISYASSDSASFKNRDIPAITLHGMNDKWMDYLHTSKDKIGNVNISSVHAGYIHGLIIVSKVENSPCDAFR